MEKNYLLHFCINGSLKPVSLSESRIQFDIVLPRELQMEVFKQSLERIQRTRYWSNLSN